jgi:hypothetical protein
VGVKVTGLDKAIKAMQKVASGQVLERPTKKYTIRVKSIVKNYPTALSPDWRRTGNLGRKWFANSGKGGAEFINTAPYAGWVQDYRQVWWHARTGWKQIEKVAEDQYGYYKTELAREYEGLV